MKHEKKKRLFFCARKTPVFLHSKNTVFACAPKMSEMRVSSLRTRSHLPHFRGKRGYFFTLDAFVAMGVIMVGLVLVFSLRSEQVEHTQAELFSKDMVSLFASTRIYEINNEYVDELKENKTITNVHYTVLETIGELVFLNKTDVAKNLTAEVTVDIIPENYGFELVLDNKSVYMRNVAGEDFYANPGRYDVLLSSKRIISGEINRSIMWGPLKAELRVWR